MPDLFGLDSRAWMGGMYCRCLDSGALGCRLASGKSSHQAWCCVLADVSISVFLNATQIDVLDLLSVGRCLTDGPLAFQKGATVSDISRLTLVYVCLDLLLDFFYACLPRVYCFFLLDMLDRIFWSCNSSVECDVGCYFALRVSGRTHRGIC